MRDRRSTHVKVRKGKQNWGSKRFKLAWTSNSHDLFSRSISSANVKKKKKNRLSHVSGDFETDICDEIEGESSVVGSRRDMQVLVF